MSRDQLIKKAIGEREKMKNYLSFGGGVNSVAMMLLMLDQGQEFEAIFVDHETDWPETYEYFDMFQEWLKDNGHQQITVLKPEYTRKKDNKVFNSLYEYCMFRKIVPTPMMRWCTRDFKVKPIYKYVETPCFMNLGIDAGEAISEFRVAGYYSDCPKFHLST